MSQFHFTAGRYLELMRDAVPVYDELQKAIADGTAHIRVKRILDLGAGTGETAKRVLALHPSARVTLVDTSAEMLKLAANALAPEQIEASVVADITEPLPPGPFEAIVSAFAIHHLDAAAKAQLFRRVAKSLTHSGTFVIGDVVLPDDPADAVTPISLEDDRPERTSDLVTWISDGGLSPRVAWSWRDLVVIVSEPLHGTRCN